MQKVVIIGGDSYVAGGLEKYLTDCHVTNLHFDNWRDNIKTLKDADCVVNFSIAPEFSKQDVMPDEVIDTQIAKTIRNTDTRFIFISSRKVYGSSNECVMYTEDDALNGVDFYAKNKIITEHKLNNILGDKLTVLRLSNIVGEPVNRTGYKTFIGWICENYINQGHLVVSQNSRTVKDFVTKRFIHECLAEFIKKDTSGTYNLSAGFGMTIGDILNGYLGKSNVKYIGEDEPLFDQFVLDNSKLTATINKKITREEISEYLQDCRKQLHSLKNNDGCKVEYIQRFMKAKDAY